MPATTDPHVLACPACRQTFPSRQALRRHDALDHRPAPDGAELTARLVGAAASDHQPTRPVAADDPAVPDDGAPPAPASRSPEPGGRVPVGWVLVLVLLTAAALPVPLSLVVVSALLVLVCGSWAHRHLGEGPHGSDPHDQQRRSPAA